MDKQPPILSSHSRIPLKTDLINESCIPLTISFAPDSRCVVPEATSVTRCDNCKCYINLYVEVILPGFEWRCNLCFKINRVPVIFNRLKDVASTGTKFSPSMNKINNTAYESIELNSEIYEVPTSPNFVLKSPTQPVLVFIVEFTEISMKNFTVTTILNEIKENMARSEERLRYCIIFSNEFCHILNKNGSLTIVPDLKNLPSMFTDDFMFRNNIEFDLSSLDKLTPGHRFDLYGALSLATSVLKLTGGSIMAFFSSMPFFLGEPGNAYIDLSRKMSHYAICVDLFMFPTINLNLKEIYILTQATGGMIFYYPNFNGSDIYFVNRFVKDFSMLFEQGFYNDAICKIRGSDGVSIKEYYGNFTKKSNDILAFSNFKSLHSITIKYTVSSPRTDVCFQIAILRTVKNRRMIRVTNFCVPFDESNELYSHINPYAVACHLSASIMQNHENGREKIDKFLSRTVNAYKKKHSAFLPQNLEILPLLCLSLSKSLPLRPLNQTPMDYRIFYVYLFTNMHFSFVDFLIHPVLLPLHSIVMNSEIDPTHALNYATSLSIDSINPNGLYLLDTGINIFFFDTGCEITDQIVGKIDSGRFNFEKKDNPFSIRTHEILTCLDTVKPISHNFLYVKEGKQSVYKDIFMSYLICDKNNGMENYLEYVEKFNK